MVQYTQAMTKQHLRLLLMDCFAIHIAEALLLKQLHDGHLQRMFVKVWHKHYYFPLSCLISLSHSWKFFIFLKNGISNIYWVVVCWLFERPLYDWSTTNSAPASFRIVICCYSLCKNLHILIKRNVSICLYVVIEYGNSIPYGC